MKKIFLLIAIGFGFISLEATAQQQPLRFGIKAGVNMAEWQGESVNSVSEFIEFSDGSLNRRMREGFHVGGYVTIPIVKGFEIEPGLQYSQKGSRLVGKIPLEQVDFLNAQVTVTNKAEYIDLPVMAKVYIGEGFHVYGGPQVSYLVSNKVKAEAGALGFNALNREWDMKSGLREFDVALAGGVGYSFQSGFNVSAGYDYGLSTIDQRGNFDTFNRVIKASIGYTF